VVLVRQQGDVDLAQAAILPACTGPCEQAVLGVCGREHDAGAACSEVGGPFAKGDDLGRADEGPRHRDEAEDEPLFGRGVVC
jgi:hypothetical protein